MIRFSDIEEKLKQLSEVKPAAEQTADIKEQLYTSPYLKAAAVMIFYDPESIMPLSIDVTDEKKKELIKELIGLSEIVFNYGNEFKATEIVENDKKLTKLEQRVSYYIKDDVRKLVLKELFSENKIKEALDANAPKTYNSNVLLQHLFTECLLGNFPDIQKTGLQELTALQRINDWLSFSLSLEASKKALERRIEMEEMLSPFKHLTGNYLDGVFVEKFRGRKEELAVLREYVGVAPPRGTFESIKRHYHNIVEPVFNWDKKPPLLIFGLGGVGKSTLVAKFILEHAEAHTKDRFPFVYLDFDKQSLSASDPETLLIESARQLSIQYVDEPQLSQSFKAYYNTWKNKHIVVSEEMNSESIRINANVDSIKSKLERDTIVAEFVTLVQQLSKIEKKPFLIVIDTFEEVQYKGQDCVKQLYGFMQLLQEEYPLLRLVVAGRAPVTQIKIQELELGDLDREAVIGFLSKAGITDTDLAKKIASKVGGNPLTLKLAVELVKKYGAEELDETTLTKKKLFFFEDKLPEIQIQGILYRRILNHIHNPEVLKLAHPGLVLRQITSELILKVLATPCQLTITSIAEAETLFNEISREVSLVTLVNPATLKHRPDVRKMMLHLINEDSPEMVKAIHTAAVAYYQDREGVMARAEEFYHRLCLNESPRALDTRWMDGIQNYILSSIDELPAKAQAYLSARTGIDIGDASIWENADAEDWERKIIRTAANFLNTGQAEKVLATIVDTTKNISKKGILSLFKVRALLQIGRDDEALSVANQLLNSYYANELDPRVKAELIKCVNNIKEKEDQQGGAITGFVGTEMPDIIDTQSDSAGNNDMDESASDSFEIQM